MQTYKKWKAALREIFGLWGNFKAKITNNERVFFLIPLIPEFPDWGNSSRGKLLHKFSHLIGILSFLTLIVISKLVVNKKLETS